jgi:hypothetical protein
VLAIGDFDGNGTSDLLLQNQSGVNVNRSYFSLNAQQYYVWSMDGSGNVAATIPVNGTIQGGIQAAGDYDASGRTELLFNLGSNKFNIVNLVQNGDHYDASATNLFTGSGSSLPPGQSIAANGSPTAYSGDRAWNTFNTDQGALNGGNFGVVPAVSAVGDLNGDGTQDILWAAFDGSVTHYFASNMKNDAQASSIQIGVAEGPVQPQLVNGSPSFDAASSAFGLMSTGDYNGDKVSDLLFESDNATGTKAATVEAWNLDHNDQIVQTPVLGSAAQEWHLLA